MSELLNRSNFDVRYTQSDGGKPVAEVVLVVDLHDAQFYADSLPARDIEGMRWNDIVQNLKKIEKDGTVEKT